MLDMTEKADERRRRDAVDAPGLAETGGPHGGEFLAHFVRKAADRGVVEVGRQFERLVAPHRRGVRLLTFEIDGILRVDADLFGDPGRNAGKRGPDTRKPRPVDAGMGKQIEAGAADSVLVKVNAVFRRFRWR